MGRPSHYAGVIVGLGVASLGAVAYTQSSFLGVTESKIETREKGEITIASDPLVERGFQDLYGFCMRSQTAELETEERAQLQGSAKEASLAIATSPAVPPSQQKPSEGMGAGAEPVGDTCANFQSSLPAKEPEPEPKSPSWRSRLEPFSRRFFPARPVAAESPVLLPAPPATEGLGINQMARLAKVPILMYHDILPKKEVFFDVTPEELESHFQYLRSEGMTPIHPDWLIAHLKTGVPLPQKPVLLSFDDGYGGHYEHVFPLLQKYNYPALFSIYVDKMKGNTGRSSITWDQLKQMSASPLVTIAAHSISHPRDLRELNDDDLSREILQSKRILEEKLGRPVDYFTYPEGKYDARVKQWVISAGYKAAFTMSNTDENFAGESPDMMAIARFGQSRIREISPQAWGGYPAPVKANAFNFATPIQRRDFTIDKVRFTIVSGGRPGTIYADSRYQVPEILAGTGAIAGVDGGFFSLKYLNSNVMIGPVMSLSSGFVPGNKSENPRLNGRPLALISSDGVRFIPFEAAKHNTFAGIAAEARPGEMITDAFVGAAWLVRDGKPQPYKSFGTLFDFDARRHRAFWGINQAGQPVVGVSKDTIGSVALGRALYQMGFRDAIMVDSGASTSLAYKGESLVEYTPRPVPHVVALFPALKPPQPAIAPQSGQVTAR